MRIDGRRVRDDYWEAKALKQGFSVDDLAGEKRPGGARQRAALEAASAEAQRDERAEVLEKVAAFLSANPLPLRTQPDRRATTQIERLSTRLEGTYSDEQFADRR